MRCRSDDATAHPRTKVIIADPDPLSRGAISDMLQSDPRFVVVAQAKDGAEAAELAIHYEPDVLLCELVLPRLDGIGVARRVLERKPGVRVVLLTGSEDEELAMQALRAGVSGVLDKAMSPDAIRAAVLTVRDGQAAIPPALTMHLIDRLRHIPEAGRGFRPVRSALTTREWEILDLLVCGMGTREIAEELVLTEDTIYSHLKHVMRKLGVRSRGEAVEAAKRLCETPVAA